MILTNKFSAECNLERIDRDFDIFVVEKTSRGLDRTNILDIPTQQFQARAVQYVRGSKAYVLFDKDAVNARTFRNAIGREYPDATVQPFHLLDKQGWKRFFFGTRPLVQLLVNSLRTPRMEGFSYNSYNNLTGKLFYGRPEWRYIDRTTKEVYSLYCLELAFDKGMYLNLRVKTFRSVQRNEQVRDQQQYLFDPGSGFLRRKLKTDKTAPDKLFVEGGFDGRRNTVPYLDFSSSEKFSLCKLGVMECFLQDVERRLGQYVTLKPGEHFGEHCYRERKEDKKCLSETDYANILKEWGVNIVDELHTPESEAIAARVASELERFYGIDAKQGPLSGTMYNIRIIHTKEYYQSNDLPDPHQDCFRGMTVQHLTLEDHKDLQEKVGKKASAVIRKVLLELILKGDVRVQQIRVYNWEKLSLGKDWTFVERRKMEEDDLKKAGSPHPEDGEAWYQYFSVQITPSGAMTFQRFYDLEACESEREERICSVFDMYSDEQYKYGKTVEGLLFSDIQNIHVLIRTNEKTMPNTREIWKTLKETNPKEDLDSGRILEAISSFRDEYPQYADYANRLASSLASCAFIKKGDLKKLVNVKLNAGREFNRYLHGRCGIWVAPEWKNADFSEEFMLGNVTDIQYFEDADTDGTGKLSFNYYASLSKGSLKSSVPNASVIRQVQAENTIDFQNLLPLMFVDFVRSNGYTVKPFPFKYLREYENWG